MTKKHHQRVCAICFGEFLVAPQNGSRYIRHCQQGRNIPNESCWYSCNTTSLSLFAETMRTKWVKSEVRRAARKELFAKVVDSIRSLGVYEAIKKITDDDRALLLFFASEELKIWLEQLYEKHNFSYNYGLVPILYPELPPNILKTLKEYEARHKRRMLLRLKNGHYRSPLTLHKMMEQPIALAVLMRDKNHTSWGSFNIKVLHDFLRDRTSYDLTLKRFIAFIDDTQPFQDNRGKMPSRKGKSHITSTANVPVLRPDELREHISEARERLTVEEFFLFWLVAKLGVGLKVAYNNLTLQNIALNSEGRVVIRPHQAWVKLPDRLSKAVVEVVQRIDPNWPYQPVESAPNTPVLYTICQYNQAGHNIFKGNINLLRRSALLASMIGGVHDRMTLHAVTGASLPTIRKLEFRMTADMHSLLPHAFAKRRNKLMEGKE